MILSWMFHIEYLLQWSTKISMKKVVILGVSGSIGKSSIDVIRHNRDKFEIVLASVNSSVSELDSIIKEFDIKHIAVTDMKAETSHINGSKLLKGKQALIDALKSLEFDIVINAISGSAGLEYSYTVADRKCVLALANKESLVMAGQFFQDVKAEIVPVDSEHSAILQALGNAKNREVKQLIITASGGPFRTVPVSKIENMSVSEALAHPTWSMGAKISIDSASMMNKGLEVIEAHWLFNIEYDRITAVIHPQSIIHSMVKFLDGSMIAQMSNPSMTLPIQYALNYPEHCGPEIVDTDILSIPALTFESIPEERYPLFYLALKAGKTGGSMPCILNAANESAVMLFINEKIKFSDIYKLTAFACNKFSSVSSTTIEDILELNIRVQKFIEEEYKQILLSC